MLVRRFPEQHESCSLTWCKFPHHIPHVRAGNIFSRHTQDTHVINKGWTLTQLVAAIATTGENRNALYKWMSRARNGEITRPHAGSRCHEETIERWLRLETTLWEVNLLTLRKHLKKTFTDWNPEATRKWTSTPPSTPASTPP